MADIQRGQSVSGNMPAVTAATSAFSTQRRCCQQPHAPQADSERKRLNQRAYHSRLILSDLIHQNSECAVIGLRHRELGGGLRSDPVCRG